MHSDNPALVSVIGADIKGKVSLACYITAIPLALWQPWLAGALYVTVALIQLIPDRRLERALGSQALSRVTSSAPDQAGIALESSHLWETSFKTPRRMTS